MRSVALLHSLYMLDLGEKPISYITTLDVELARNQYLAATSRPAPTTGCAS